MRGDRRGWFGYCIVNDWPICGFVCGMGGCDVCGGKCVVFVGLFVVGVLRRVCLMWMRGATFAMCGAVGLVEVGTSVRGGAPFVVGVSPFEAGQGSVVSS